MGHPRGKELLLLGKRWSRQIGLGGNSLAALGQLIVQGLNSGMHIGLVVQAAKQLAIDSGSELALGRGTRWSVEKAARQLATRQLQAAGRKVTDKAIESQAGKLLPAAGKIAGTGVGAFFTAYSLWSNCSQYSQGNITQRDLVVHSGLDIASGAGAIIATWAVAGSSAGPLGTVAGIGLAVIAQGGKFLYDYYTAEERRLQEETRRLARGHADMHEQEKRRKMRLQALQHSAREKWESGWQLLLPAPEAAP